MVTLEIISTGEEIDVEGTLTYVKQVADLGDITKAVASHSWTLNFPKTPRTTRIFKGLGLVGSRSRTPYERIQVAVKDNGLYVVENVYLVITGTEETYKGYLQEGISEFFNAVSSDVVSDVIDLSSLGHLNTVENIIASFSGNENYEYIIADYNGQKLEDISGTTNLNPFALSPSIKLEYLWEKIFEYYGWTYSGEINLAGKYMTYPNGIGYSSDGNFTLFEGSKDDYNSSPHNQGVRVVLPFNTQFINTAFVSTNQLNTIFTINQTGNYLLRVKLSGKTRLIHPFTTIELPIFFEVWQGITPVTPMLNTQDNSEEIEVQIIASAGSNVSVRATIPNFPGSNPCELRVEESYFKIETLGVQVIDFSEALIKYKVKDFVKEVMIRGGLTAFADAETKHIEFKNVAQRVTADVIDWSDKYLERISESYVYDGYAQNNFLKHKYNDENDSYNDGNLKVDNKNQPIEKELFRSQTYSPLEQLTEYKSAGQSFWVNNFKMFDVELKEDAETGELLADYKGLKDRFYVLEKITRNTPIRILGEEVLSFPVAKLTGSVYKDIAGEKYSLITAILDDSKVHNIKLKLNQYDFLSADLSKTYYFEQESAKYILNKLTYKSGEPSIGEFVMIK